jgi:Ca2+-binding RTX toxin-like protein
MAITASFYPHVGLLAVFGDSLANMIDVSRNDLLFGNAGNDVFNGKGGADT